MDEIERDSDITINVGFGNITFGRDDAGSYARAVVDISIDHDASRENKLEVAVCIPCSPETETVMDVVEKSRQTIATLLRSAATHFENETAHGFLYRESP